MANDPPDLSPADARDRWLSKRSVSLADHTLTDYHYRLKQFTDWCESKGIGSMQALTPWLVDEFDAKRKGDDLAPVTLRNHQQTVKSFLEWAESVGLAANGVADAIEIPDVDRSEHVSDTRLEPEAARRLLDHFRSGPARASKQHVVFEVLWVVGCRMGGLRGLDVGDVDREANVLEFRHRPERDTPLKNGPQGERDVGVTDETMAVLGEWIDNHRPTVHDEYGREPLLPTAHGRVAETTLQNWCYHATAPCRYQECPHGNAQPTCEYWEITSAMSCPSTRSPHQIRSGSITWQRNRGMGVEVVARRVNASVEVINKHYDLPTKREAFEQRERDELEKLELEQEDTDDA